MPLCLWFVEDRLKPAVVQQQTLTPSSSTLADWGYNTASEREAAQNDPIQMLSLSQFVEDFSAWP